MQKPKKDQIKAPSSPRAARVWPWIFLLLTIAFVVVVRVRLLTIPLERDEGEYAYAGQLILQGIPPYELVYNIKLPGTYAAYALLMAIFGQTTVGVHLGLMTVNVAAIVFVFLFVRRLIDDYAAAVASVIYAFMTIGPAVLGFAGHATHFVVLASLGGFLLMQRGADSGRLSTLSWSGFLFGVGFLCKQPGIFLGAAGGLWLLMESKGVTRNVLVKRVGAFCVGMVAPYLLTCLILWRAGVFEKFWRWTVTYAGGHSVPLKAGVLGLLDYFWNIAGPDNVLWILALCSLVFLPWIKTIPRGKKWFIVAFLVLSFAAICPGLYFSEHYFILMAPAVALTIGAAASGARAMLATTKAGKILNYLPASILLCVVGWLMYVERTYFFQVPPAQIGAAIYYMNPFDEAMEVAAYIRLHSKPDSRIAVLGSEPEIYFYAQRRSATGYIYGYDLMLQRSYAIDMQNEMIREIENVRPEFIVLVNNLRSWTVWPKSDKIIFRWGNSYTEKFYDLVGSVDQLESGETFYHWDDEAKKARIKSNYFILVYKRKA